MALTDYLNRRIRLAQARVEKEQKRLAAIVKEVQKTCKHAHVAEQAYRAGEFSGYSPPRRICLVCGREESATMWPSSYAELHEPDLENGGMKHRSIKKTELNDELVHKVSDVYRYRPTNV